MTFCKNIPVVEEPYTVGDLEDPLKVRWGEPLTTEASELLIERPDDTVVTLPGVLIDATTGTYKYPWRVGDLVVGDNQLVKARLYRSGNRRKSTRYFKINVETDLL